MAKAESKKQVKLRVVTKPTTEQTEPIPEVKKEDLNDEAKEEVKSLPKIRLQVEENAEKVKKFATAQGLSMHLQVVKAKKVGLTALHKVATWLTPKNKK